MLTFPSRYTIDYFHPGVRAEIEAWPVDVLERWDWYFPQGGTLEDFKARAREAQVVYA